MHCTVCCFGDCPRVVAHPPVLRVPTLYGTTYGRGARRGGTSGAGRSCCTAGEPVVVEPREQQSTGHRRGARRGGTSGAVGFGCTAGEPVVVEPREQQGIGHHRGARRGGTSGARVQHTPHGSPSWWSKWVYGGRRDPRGLEPGSSRGRSTAWESTGEGHLQEKMEGDRGEPRRGGGVRQMARFGEDAVKFSTTRPSTSTLISFF